MKISDKKSKDSYNLIMYVMDSTTQIKKFTSSKKMEKFINDFHKKYPSHLPSDSGCWIDYAVMGVTGEVHFFSDGIKIK